MFFKLSDIFEGETRLHVIYIYTWLSIYKRTLYETTYYETPSGVGLRREALVVGLTMPQYRFSLPIRASPTRTLKTNLDLCVSEINVLLEESEKLKPSIDLCNFLFINHILSKIIIFFFFF